MKFKALAAYVFAGGFTEGVKKHFDVLEHFENGNYGVDTSKAMHGVAVSTDPPSWPTGMYRDKVDFIYANPPCAPWSSAGCKVKGESRDYATGVDPRDPRVQCLYHVFQLLESVRPKVLAFESVWQIWSKGRPIIEDLARKANSLGYRVSVIMHDGFDCGVPQHRKRAFIVFHKTAIAWEKPNEAGPKTVREAWAMNGIVTPDDGDDAEEGTYFNINPEHVELWEEVGPGGYLVHAYNKKWGDNPPRNPKTGNRAGAPGFLWKVVNPDRHSFVVTGSAMLFHHLYPRTLTWHEQKALCGYPATYDFAGPLGKKFQQIAQAVMPPVGAWLAKVVKAALVVNEPCDVGFRVHDFLTKDGKWEEVIS